jgi:hypothetical protein
VKIIEACVKLYNDKDYHTNGNANGHSGDVDYRVIPVTAQTSECGFKIIFKHAYFFLCSRTADAGVKQSLYFYSLKCNRQEVTKYMQSQCFIL